MSMAGVFTAFAWLFATLGTGPLVVQRRELPETLLRSLTTLGICMGLVLTAALALAAVPIARFYGEPRVVWIVVALAASFALTSIGLVPEGLLQRNLQFSRLVTIDAAQMVVSSVVSIALAAAGWGAWSLVTGNLLGMAVRSGALVASSPWRVRLGFDLQATRGVVGFGASVMGFNVVHYAARYTDRLLIGRMLGATSLGYYDYAYRFYMYPLEVITSVLMRLMFPTFARLQEDRAQLGRAFLRTNGAIALIAFPLMGGLAVVADPFVRVVLGDKWAPIIPLVQILAPMAMLQALGATPGQLFLACGKAAFRFWWSVDLHHDHCGCCGGWRSLGYSGSRDGLCRCHVPHHCRRLLAGPAPRGSRLDCDLANVARDSHRHTGHGHGHTHDSDCARADGPAGSVRPDHLCGRWCRRVCGSRSQAPARGR